VLSVRRCASAVTTAAVVMGLGLVALPAARADVKTVDVLAAELVVAPEDGPGVSIGTAFRHFVDADDDGCTTYQEVLLDESVVEPRFFSGSGTCAIFSGEWSSLYDGVLTTEQADLSVDHTVALEEAWTSGAWRWTDGQREAYANDLDRNGFSLEAVTDAVHASKGMRDLAEWLPPQRSAWCEYATRWVATKWRWNLSADTSELAAARSLLRTDGCGRRTLDVDKAGTPPAVPGPVRSSIGRGTELASGSELVSANGRYRAAMQADGNLVVYTADGRPVWASMTFSPGASLLLQADGNMVINATRGKTVWFTSTFGTPGNGGGARLLRLGDDGNLVLYRGTDGTRPIWYSGWDSGRRLDPTRGNVLLAGVQLATGQAIYSPSRRYRAVMQADGNFVVYAPGARPLWSAGSWGPDRYLVMQPDGNLVEYDLHGHPWWNARVRSPGARAVLQDDGNLVLYRPDGTPAFYTGWDRGVPPAPPGR